MSRLHFPHVGMLTVVLLAGWLVLPTGTFAAKPTFIHDSWDDTFTIDDFCGVGLVVEGHDVGHADIQLRFNEGIYAMGNVHVQGVTTYTGPNGAVITVTYNDHERDSAIVDNGDGTYTDYITVTGSPATWIFPDGTRIADHGAVTLVLVFSDNGTPGDPFDDELITGLPPIDIHGPHSILTADVLCEPIIAAFTS